jgi:ketosteroid isomerase-like protein
MNADVATHAADALTSLLATNDGEIAKELYADDAVIWHSHDLVELDRNTMVGTLGALATVIAAADVDVKQRFVTEQGFVQTHVMTYRLTSGAVTSFPAALVVRLDRDGRIARLDEYLDGAGLAPVIAALRA